MEPLNPDFIAELKKKPEKPARKGRKLNPNKREYRTYENWWKLPHLLSEQCSFCPRVRMCTRLSEDPDVLICRYCFLEGKGLND